MMYLMVFHMEKEHHGSIKHFIFSGERSLSLESKVISNNMHSKTPSYLTLQGI